jgi:hypothetical protein
MSHALSNFLGNFPWLIIIAVFLIGICTLVWGNLNAKAGVRTAGVLMTSLAVLLVAVRYMVDTDAERCELRTRNLVKSVDQKNWARMKTLLDADTVVDANGKETWPKFTGPADISDGAKGLAEKSGLKTVFLVGVKTEQTVTQITCMINVAIQADEAMGETVVSQWEFDYLPAGDAWDLRTIKLINIGVQQ